PRSRHPASLALSPTRRSSDLVRQPLVAARAEKDSLTASREVDHRSDQRACRGVRRNIGAAAVGNEAPGDKNVVRRQVAAREPERSEEHTSELQSLTNLVCRLL